MSRSQSEIEAKRDDAVSVAANSNSPQTVLYAEGVRDALAWILGDEDELELD